MACYMHSKIYQKQMDEARFVGKDKGRTCRIFESKCLFDIFQSIQIQTKNDIIHKKFWYINFLIAEPSKNTEDFIELKDSF